MKGRRHTPEQVFAISERPAGCSGRGFELPDVLRELEVSDAT
jgi:hypothetical protein